MLYNIIDIKKYIKKKVLINLGTKLSLLRRRRRKRDRRRLISLSGVVGREAFTNILIYFL